jgi:hypothetical protein
METGNDQQGLIFNDKKITSKETGAGERGVHS